MIRYILRRILLLVPVLVGLSVLVFCIARLLPGDPVRLAAGPNATAADIEGLGEAVRADVLEKTGVQLDWEIRRIGRPA